MNNFNKILISSILILIICEVNAEISNHITQCCTAGSKWAIDKNDCHNYNYGIDDIPQVWRGLCLSTFGVCCSKELLKQQCLNGRLAAKNGSNCDGNGKLNTTSYTDCCKSCQIGLVVAASGNNCSANEFSYFSKDESYMTCCNEINNNNNNNNQNNQTETSSQTKLFETNDNNNNNNNNNNEDGTFVLDENEDICKKFKLCSQICENTIDSYICKCHKGYYLDDNKVTCTKINNNDIDDDDIDEDDITDIEEDEENLSSEEIDQDICRKGYTKNEKTNDCEDIDECTLGLANKCTKDQHCSNTVGSYNCFTVTPSPSICEQGFRYNIKIEECEDINECIEEIDDCKQLTQICLNIRGGFLCQERSQTKYYNECEDNPCDANHICINYPGNYECRLKLSNVGTSSISNSKLPKITTTRINHSSNLPTDSDKCGPGYRYKHNKCIDIDECLTDKNACDSNQICTNEHGGYRCDCKIGFKMDSTTNACIDINECQINNHNCLDSQRCDNTIGSYTCIRLKSCGTGYTLNAETGNCDDDDECILKTHDCPLDYECRNTQGSFRCRKYPKTTTPRSTTTTTTTATTTSTTLRSTTIKLLYSLRNSTVQPSTSSSSLYQPGYIYNNISRNINKPTYVSSVTHSRLNSDHNNDHKINHHNQHHRYYVDTPSLPSCGQGFHRNQLGACVDIDECRIPITCESHQKCINTNGSYRCQNLLQCSGGYKSSPDGISCVDIDECITNEHNCGPDQICRNRIGGYICSCPAGHILNKQNLCIDINECEHQVCPVNSNCINTIGSYYCECKNGFKKQNENDKTCIDIDECQDIYGLCEQKCINYWGSYQCSCNPGYQINLNDNRTCDDIDECETHKSYKLCMGYCNNIPGSYECSCPNGYELGTDKNSCRDIDECSTLNLCNGRNEICTNIRGSYRCTLIQCQHGYTNDADQKNRCRIITNLCDGDECYQKPSSYTYNFITLISKMLIPPQGRTLFTLRGPHWYENIDFDLKLARTQAPANIEKATIHHFSTTKMHNQVQLNLMRSLEGPQDVELELSMTVFMNGQPRGKSIAKLLIIVSQYSF